MGVICQSIVLTTFIVVQLIVKGDSCNRRETKNGYVCVCDSTFCDTIPEYVVKRGMVQVYETSKSGNMFKPDTLQFSEETNSTNGVEISIIPSEAFQKIYGFGGAFTDAFGIVASQLPEKVKGQLMQSYFSKNGSEYNFGRVPIASCDFSTHQYSYDDYVDDFNLTKFSLAMEDHKYKIPFIKEAAKISSDNGRTLNLIGSTWSTPFWMKTNNNMTGRGTIKAGEKYSQTFANYLVRFFQEYQKQGINFWGTTMINEPSNGFGDEITFQSLGFTAEAESEFLGKYFGPALKKAAINNLKIMILDDQRSYLPNFVQTFMKNNDAKPYVDGIAFHWYKNDIAPVTILDDVHKEFPNLFILATEACIFDFSSGESHVILGSWERAQKYAFDIITDLLHWTTGWIDWNLALDLNGGPNWANNFVDAPIIVNASSGEFYKQPLYYTLAHFSKLLPPNSIRINTKIHSNQDNKNSSELELDTVAFQRPDGAFVLHVLNRNEKPVKIGVKSTKGSRFESEVQPLSLQSYVWQLW